MNPRDRFDLEVGGAIADLAGPTVPDYLDDVLRATQRTAQRPAWTFPERWLPVTVIADRLRSPSLGSLRPIMILLIIGLLVAAVAVVLVGSRPTLPAPFGLAANGAIAFGSGGDVWLADPASRAARILVAGPRDDGTPVWSLDGTRLAFIRDGRTLAIVNKDGGGLVELTDHPLSAPGMPVWSPDGRTIAIEHSAGELPQVSIIRLDGSPTVRTLDVGVALSQPTWRPPDGRQLLARGVTPAGEPNLYVLNADGTELRSLGLAGAGIDPALELHGASWSPDGTRSLYGGLEFVGPEGISRYRSHIVDADGTGDRVIAAPPQLSDVWPRWSPDGRHFLFERVRGEYLSDTDEVWLAIAEADGTGTVEVSAVVDLEGFGAVWAPDATRILAHAVSSDRLYLIDPASGEAVEQPWSPNHDVTWQRVAGER